jgi:hypothetical protein
VATVVFTQPLAEGPVPARAVTAKPAELNIADRTLDRAEIAAGVHAVKTAYDNDGEWCWELRLLSRTKIAKKNTGTLRQPWHP